MEKRVSLAWTDGLEFTATSEDGVRVNLGSAESHGTFRPAALVLVALAGCTGMDAISIMTKMRLQIDSYSHRHLHRRHGRGPRRRALGSQVLRRRRQSGLR